MKVELRESLSGVLGLVERKSHFPFLSRGCFCGSHIRFVRALFIKNSSSVEILTGRVGDEPSNSLTYPLWDKSDERRRVRGGGGPEGFPLTRLTHPPTTLVTKKTGEEIEAI